jgi:hypothetical protein
MASPKIADMSENLSHTHSIRHGADGIKRKSRDRQKRRNHMDELINEMYQTNADFNLYVNKYMRKEEVDLETALSHAMVQNYANYLMDRGEAEPTLRNLWKNDEDKGC